ncbi:MAG: APH(3') family aminoglycoside O-phosphotransferase [Advenella sp.]
MSKAQLNDDISVPKKWLHEFPEAAIERQAIGESSADVFRIFNDKGPDLFLKSEPISEYSELPNEAERLRWLKQAGLPGPAVLDYTKENNRYWLLMSAVVGCDLAGAKDLPALQVIRIMASALRALHNVPVSECPFDHRLGQRIDVAGKRVGAGLVDESDFDDSRLGRSASELFAELLLMHPTPEDLVVCHGDACLPNFMADESGFTGFIDCGRLGISDRYQDLALAVRSIERNLGPEWVKPFFENYGTKPDEERIEFYCLLDEFF